MTQCDLFRSYWGSLRPITNSVPATGFARCQDCLGRRMIGRFVLVLISAINSSMHFCAYLSISGLGMTGTSGGDTNHQCFALEPSTKTWLPPVLRSDREYSISSARLRSWVATETYFSG